MTEETTSEMFRRACIAGDSDAAHRLVLELDDPDVVRVIKRIGGPRALVRFLLQRSHVLHDHDEPLLDWLLAHLVEAEPMHVLEVAPLAAVADELGHAPIAYRIAAHLKFVQPPDPTRWSRKRNRPEEASLLAACRAGDLATVSEMLSRDEGLALARNKWDQDGATLTAAYGTPDGPAITQALVAAGMVKTWRPVTTAAWWGATDVLDVLVDAGFPLCGPIDHDALWMAACATNEGELTVATFEAVASRLVEAGADPNVANRWGRTAWGAAHADARPILEAHGATPREQIEGDYDADTGVSRRITPLFDDDIVEPRTDWDLNEAAAVGDVDRVRHLLDGVYRHGPMLVGNGPPERPLHFAAFFGQVPVVWVLIRYYGYSPGDENAPFIDGSSTGPRETWGKTALEVAVRRGQTRVVEMLLNSVDWFQGRRARRK